MPTNTTNLNLLKMDPTADGSATFNIQTMLNDNWDKLDTAVAEKEGLLRDKAVKTAAADDDSIPIVEKSGEVKKTTYLQFKAMLKTFFDLKYSPLSHKSRHASGGADAITPSDIGALDPSGDGSNVTVTFTEAANYASPTSGDSVGVVVGKLAKLFTDLKTAAFRAATDFAAAVHRHVWGDIDDKPTTFPPSTHQHGTGDITSGTLPLARGGTGAASAAAARTALGAQATLTAGTNITISGSTISATGGILPRIVATAPTGGTVTCSNGSTTLTAAEESGTWTFDLPDYGTWTVTGTLGADTDSKAVAVDQVKLYTTSLVYLLNDTFNANTWGKIIGACQNGNVPAAWVVGNQKTMTINSASYTVTIIGKNHDTYTGGGTAPLTFQLQDCYGTKYQMNSSNTNSGGWTSCAMRSTSLPAILALMPSEVRAGIKEVNKLTSAGSQSSTINTTADKLFLLSEVEVFGSVTYSKSGEGTQYAYYAAGNSKVKNFDGSANFWWERSPYGSNSTTFCGVSSNGNADTNSASSSYDVAFGFCF